MTDTKYSRAEVATHNGKAGATLWIVYKDSVYDVTNYANEHPGGKSEILEEGGKDASKAFDDVHHSSEAKTIMAKYKIGEIVEEEKYYDENGKKKKKVVSAQPGDSERKSCLSVVTCGLLG